MKILERVDCLENVDLVIYFPSWTDEHTLLLLKDAHGA